MTITFTKYLRPNGRTVPAAIDRPPEIEQVAARLVESGVRLEIEVLSTGEVSMTAENDMVDDIGPLASEIVPNGPGVAEAVDRLILAAEQKLRTTH